MRICHLFVSITHLFLWSKWGLLPREGTCAQAKCSFKSQSSSYSSTGQFEKPAKNSSAPERHGHLWETCSNTKHLPFLQDQIPQVITGTRMAVQLPIKRNAQSQDFAYQFFLWQFPRKKKIKNCAVINGTSGFAKHVKKPMQLRKPFNTREEQQ